MHKKHSPFITQSLRLAQLGTKKDPLPITSPHEGKSRKTPTAFTTEGPSSLCCHHRHLQPLLLKTFEVFADVDNDFNRWGYLESMLLCSTEATTTAVFTKLESQPCIPLLPPLVSHHFFLEILPLKLLSLHAPRHGTVTHSI